MSTDIFTPRGITPPSEGGRVAQAQGFARYEGADWRERRAELAALPSAGAFDPAFHFNPDPRKSAKAWTSWLVAALAVDGWAMPRYAIMPEHENPDFAVDPATQIRPDAPVHGRWLPAHMHRRIRGERRGREEASPRTRHAGSVCDLAPPGHSAAIEHPAGAVLPTGHLHPKTGEVVVPLEGRHHHWDQAKYLYLPGKSARRLGTSPLSVANGYEADELFVVVLEGTLKMCAVTEAGYPAIDAGSVTLWRSESEEAEWEVGDFGEVYLTGGMTSELGEFAERHLKGRRVAVVCDSDWYSNRLVLDQTEKVTGILRDAGAFAVACAPPEGPPLGWVHPYTGIEVRAKRGVDDWLGEHHPADRHDAMLELLYHERVSDAALTADHRALVGIRRDGRETTLALVRTLGEWASPEHGVAPYAEERLMASLGRAKRSVQEARRRAVECGLIEELTEAERQYDTANDSYFMRPPLVRVVPEAMPTYRKSTLREWLRKPQPSSRGAD